MDEILAAMCGDGDILLTRHPVLPAHDEHLHSAGLPRFTAMAATSNELASTLRRLHTTHVLRPWAVTSDIAASWADGGIAQPLPSPETAQRVNSKVWSTRIRNELALPGFATVVRSAADFDRTARRMFAAHPQGIVVKEPFGVSGRGSMHVTTEARLRRLVALLEEQEARGREALFVVEEFLPKLFDFSTHLTIAPDGAVSLDGVQGMVNRDLRYSMSCPLTEPWERRLRTDAHHAAIVMTTAREIFAEGYFGPLCIDGMVLTNDRVLSVVEVNARGSLGAVNARLDAYVSARGVRSALVTIPVVSDASIPFAEVLDRMVTARLPPEQSRPTGVIAMTARTLPFHGAGDAPADHGPRTGRIFISVLHSSPSEIQGWVEGMRKVLAAAGYVVT